MKAIVTVLGRDRVGIIASVCALLSEYNINILDIILPPKTFQWRNNIFKKSFNFIISLVTHF